MDNSELVKKKRNRLAAKRMRYRNKAIRLGLAVPPAMGKQKTGRKVEVEATIQGDEKRQLARVHYTSRKQMKQVINCSNVRSLANNLRPRDSKGNENIAELAGGKILELCDQIASNFSNLRDVIVGPDHNNTMISWDLSVVAQKDIEKGEEMTLSYNYST